MMETNPEWIAMSYLTLCHRSRGILWYCWSQQGGGPGGVGIKHNAEHRRDLPRITSELHALAPAFLNSASCDYFVSNGVHGVSCQDPDTKTRYMILVNPATNGAALRASIAWKGAAAETTEARGAFGGKGFPMKNGVVDATLAPLEVRTLYIDGPAPVAVVQPPVPKVPAGKGKTLHVGEKKDYTTIQAAVDAAEPGDTILVEPGVYAPFSTRNDHLVIRGRKGADKTFVDGGATNRAATLTARPYGLMTAETNTVLEGLTLRNGNAMAIRFHKNFGGCVLGGTLRDCVVTGGEAQYGGGVAHGRLESTTVEKCHATKMGGATTHSVLVRSAIRDNTSDYDGGGLAFSHASDCRIESNRAMRDGGGARFGSLNRCILVKNEAGRNGGAIKLSSHGALNCLFDGNRAGEEGGGAHGSNVEHGTFVKNSAATGGGASGGTIQQCVLWGNSATDKGTASHAGAIGRLHASCVEWTSTNPLPADCTAADPLFRGKEDFRPQGKSPCIDLGGGISAPGATDLAGEPRRLGRMTDAGCYEVGALPFPAFVDKEEILFQWTMPEAALKEKAAAEGAGEAEDEPVVPPFRERIALPEGKETTDLRVSCRFRAKKNQTGPLVRFESAGGAPWLDLSIRPNGRLYGVVGYNALLDTGKVGGEKNRTRVKCTAKKETVTDGQWHEVVFTLRALNVDVALTDLTLDGKPLGPEFPWFRECHEAIRLKDGELIVGGKKAKAYKGEITDVKVEALPSTNR